MRKRALIFFCGLVVIVVGGIVYRHLPDHQPRYQGRTLSDWFKQYYRSSQAMHWDPIEHKQAARAMCAMGTNAVPWLVSVSLSQDSDSPFKTNVLAAASKIGRPLHFPPFVPSWIIRGEAGEAIDEIKPPASLLLPLVTNALNGRDKKGAPALLGTVGSEAEMVIPYLRQLVQSSNRWERGQAVNSLARLGGAAKPALPELMELAKTENSRQWAFRSACSALGNIAAYSTNAVPILKERLAAETFPRARRNIIVALCRIGENAEELDLLIEEMKRGTNTDARTQAISALGEIGPNAKGAAPVLREALNDEQVDVWYAASGALIKIGGETDFLLSTLAKKSKSKDDRSRFAATTLILKLDPNNQAAMSNLVEFIRDQAWCAAAFSELSELGYTAKPAVPALREAAQSKDKYFRETARKVLQSIEDDIRTK